MKSGFFFDFESMIPYKTKTVGRVTAIAIITFENISVISNNTNETAAITIQPNILMPLSILGAVIIL